MNKRILMLFNFLLFILFFNNIFAANISLNESFVKKENNISIGIKENLVYSKTEIKSELKFNKNKLKFKEGLSKYLDLSEKTDKKYLFVQFYGQLSKQDIKNLNKKRIKVLNKFENNVYIISFDSSNIVYLTENSKTNFQNLDFNPKLNDLLTSTKIFSANEIKSEFKLSKNLAKKSFAPIHYDENGDLILIIKLHKDVDLKKFMKKLKKLNVETVANLEEINSLEISTSENNLETLSNFDEVIYIQENYPKFGNELDSSKGIIQATSLFSGIYNLNGEGIEIFQYEKGIPDDYHNDLENRIMTPFLNNTPYINQHATMVAGILIGNGSLNSNLDGIAPKATIWADIVDDVEYNKTEDIISDYFSAFSSRDSDLGSNSWGFGIKNNANLTTKNIVCPYYGDYESVSEFLDKVVSGYGLSYGPNTVVFSAGNERVGTLLSMHGCDGVENFSTNYPYYTINPPKASKNIISVGSVDIWETNENKSSDFSSFGPTDDGRIKPDLVAPGSVITSTGLNNTYVSDSGTSMAAPHVSGTIALMLEQWNKQYSKDPLPSTIKAMLLDSATDLSKEGNGIQIIDGPDYKNGYGLLNAKEAVDRIINETFLEDNLTEDQTKVYAINISNQNELKVTLAWDDLPGLPSRSSEGVLINDLNLKLIAPNGSIHYPWILDPTNPSANATKGEDHLNNVEQVYVSNPINGEWLVIIDETNIDYSVNEQKFSLVSRNKITNSLPKLNNDSIQLHYAFENSTTESITKVQPDLAPNQFTTDKNSNQNSAVELNGNSDLLIHNYSQNAFNIQKDFTISMWVKLDTLKDTILADIEGSSSSTSSYNAGIIFGYDSSNWGSNKLNLFVGSNLRYNSVNTYLDSQSSLNSNEWYHLVASRKNNVAKIFINGELDSINENFNTNNINWDAGSANYEHDYNAFGAWRHVNSVTRYLDGSMDEITVWNKALEDYEIKQLYQNGINITKEFETTIPSSNPIQANTSLKAHYKLDDLTDSSLTTNSNLINYNSILTTDRNNNLNSAYDFSGSSWMLAGNQQNIFDIQKDFTISFWAKFDSFNDNTLINLEGSSSSVSSYNAGILVMYDHPYWRSDKLNLFVGSKLKYNSANTYLASQSSLNSNQWYYITIVRENNQAKIFIDGQLDSINSNFNTNNVNWDALHSSYEHDYNTFGTWQHTSSRSRYFDGKLDDVAIWNIALSNDEVARLYDYGIEY